MFVTWLLIGISFVWTGSLPNAMSLWTFCHSGLSDVLVWFLPMLEYFLVIWNSAGHMLITNLLLVIQTFPQRFPSLILSLSAMRSLYFIWFDAVSEFFDSTSGLAFFEPVSLISLLFASLRLLWLRLRMVHVFGFCQILYIYSWQFDFVSSFAFVPSCLFKFATLPHFPPFWCCVLRRLAASRSVESGVVLTSLLPCRRRQHVKFVSWKSLASTKYQLMQLCSRMMPNLKFVGSVILASVLSPCRLLLSIYVFLSKSLASTLFFICCWFR